jgi:hypothetical protein
VRRCELYTRGSGEGTMADSFELRSETTDPINFELSSDRPSFFQKVSAQWN